MLFSSVGYVLLPSASVWANPTGEQVVGGSATFQRDGNKLTVNQATDRLAVNWQTFNIAAGEHTHFNMPSAASIALNRVLGGNPSDIRGMLTGNGTIIVVNSFGISMAPGSVIKTGSFMATTRDINPDQFMHADLTKGINLYGDSTAPILNQGSITAEKGDVFLIAQKVENRGTISAPKGKAALVGTGRPDDKTEVVLHEVGGSGFAVRVTQLEGDAAGGSNHGLPDGEELLNEGVISAAQAELSASGNIYALAIKNSGTVRAKGVLAQADGTVRLDGGLGDVRNTGMLIAKNAGDEATASGGRIDMTGRNVTASPESIITAAGGELGGNGGKVKIDSADTTIVQGKVDVAAPSANAKGGKVELLGERVGLFDGAKVDASGGAGGGTVLVGGDYLGGRTPSADLKDLAKLEAEPVKNAKATVMADTAEIKADATVDGDGGKVILWSDEYTGFYGELFARGGAESGDGGFIETSSKDNLQAFGNGNASALQGAGGLWLLDPANVVITAATANNMTAAPNFAPTANNGQVSAAVINTQLGLGTSVTVTTAGAGTQSGDIIVESAIAPAVESAVGASLTLNADRNIIVAAPITLRGGNIIMTAGNTTTTGILAVNADLSTTGGIGIAGGNVSLNTGASGSIELGADITTISTAVANSGSITFNSRPVLLTANVALDAGQEIGGSINFGSSVSSLNSPFTMTITTQSGNVTFAGPVGAGSVAGALPLGGLTINPGTGTTTLNGNIFTAAGLIDIGTAVVLGGIVNIDTTRLGNINGAGISFRQSVTGNSFSLTLTGGETGGLLFGGNVSGLTGFTVTSGGNFTVDNASSFNVAGNILIQPAVVTGGNDFAMATSANGNITLNAGLDARPTGTGKGRNVTLTAAGSGNVVINGEVNASGVSGTFILPGPPPTTVATVGFDGGTITISSGTGTITTGNLLVNGDRDQTGNSRGGAAGTISVTSGGVKTIAGIFAQGGQGSPAGKGGTVSLSGNGNNVVTGEISLTGGNGQLAGDVGGSGGVLNISGTGSINISTASITATGGDGGASSSGGRGGNINLNSSGSTIAAGPISTQGGRAFQGVGGYGGSIDITASGTVTLGFLDSSGGSNTLGVGGNGGNITISTGADFRIPTLFLATGGQGTNGGSAFSGRGGTVSITTSGAGSDVAFSSDTLTLQGDMNLKVRSAGHIIFGTVADFNNPLSVQAGTFFTYNAVVNNQGEITPSLLSNRGTSVFEFGATDRSAQFFMPSSSVILSNGGLALINRVNGLAPLVGTDGIITLSGAITTSASNFAGGQLVINTTQPGVSTVGTKAAVVVNSSINTSGGLPTGTATDTQYGRSGGAVTIAGTSLILNQITTKGSSSLATATSPAFGGAGGNISLSADTTITLRRNLDASGGIGLGVGDAQGGGGGSINLNGNVVLNSLRADLGTIVLSSQEGASAGAAAQAVGGNINVSGTITGTESTSNTLDLRYGSGVVTLGDGVTTDRIDVGTLITATDNALSVGTLRIKGELSVDTLTTYARGYSIEILGGGAVATLTNFLNTGYVQVGDTTGDVMEFTAGMNTQNGPSATVLAGTLQTSREVSDAGLLFGNVELFKTASLNTFGNTLQVGTLNAVDDGVAGASPGLTLKGQVGNGIVNFTGAVGASAGLPSALDGQTLEAPGTITLETPVDANGNAVARTSPIIFGQAVTTGAFVQQSGAALAFNGDVTLQGTGNVDSIFDDEVSLINLAYADDPDAVLSVSSALGRSVTFNGAVLLESGPIELTGAGDFTLGATGTLDGVQDLFLSGNGTKDFSAGTVGGDTPLGTGFGPAITMSGGQVTFGDLETASGLDSTTAPVEFTGVVILGNGDTATTLDANVTFNGADITSSDGFTVGGVTTVSADSTLSGALASDNYHFIGNVNGAGSLTLEGLGAKQFDGLVSLVGFSQANGSGTVTFADAVTTSGVNTFNGRVVLDGPMAFTSNGAMTTFGDSASDSLTLSSGGVTLLGTGAYTVNATVNGGSQNLSLDGNTTKTFQAGVSSLGTLTLSAGTANFNSTLGATALSQDAGTLNLSGNVTLAGASTLRTANLAGITWINTGPTTLSGQVTTTGITAMNSSLFTLNFATPLVSSGTRLTLNGNVDLAATATLGGTGAITVNGTVNGAVADTQSLTLSGAGAKTFSSSIGTTTRLVALTQSVGSGLATFGGDISLQSNATFNESIVLNGVDLTSATGSVTFGTAGTDSLTVGAASSVTTDTLGAQSVVFNSGVSLNSRLAVDSDTATLNNMSGSSANLDVTANNLNVIGNLQTGTGVVTLTKRDNTALQVGGVLGDFLTAAEINRIRTSGGLNVETAGNISLLSLGETDTDGITGPLRFNSTAGNISVTAPATIPIFGGQAGTLSGLGNLTTGGFNGLTLRTGGLTYASSGSLSLAELDLATDLDVAGSGLTVTGGISTGGRADLAATGGNITVAGRIVAPTAITVDAGGGYFVNSVGGNPFTSADTRILTRNLFSTFPANGAVTGLSNIFGATSISQVGANSVGIAESLLQGSAGPYVTEFTTGTGQPYILATQNAVPAVMIPMPITVAGAFPTRLTYTQEELELLTPEERSAYEAMQRQQATRVILEQPAGYQGESEVPAEGGTPQAQAPATEPVPPTAQVYLDGKPLAGQSDRNHRNATQFTRLRPERAFVQKSGASWPSSWLEQERMTAEVNVGSLPLAKAK